MLKKYPFPTQKKKRRNLLYFDNAASSRRGFYLANLLIDVFGKARSSGDKQRLLIWAERRLSTLLGIIPETDSKISFVPNATYGLNQIAYLCTATKSWTQPSKISRVIYLSYEEHASNHLIWLKLAKHPIKYLKTEQFLGWKLPAKSAIFSFTSNTNLEGIQISLDDINIKFWNSKHICIVDASQLLQHSIPKLTTSPINYLVFTAHKFFGPNGLGVVYSRDHLPIGVNSFNYFLLDLGFDVDLDSLESWIDSLDVIEELFDSGFARRQHARLRRYFERYFPKDNAYVSWVNQESKSLIFLLKVIDENISAHDYAFYLGKRGVIVRTGLSCSWLSGKKFEGRKIIRVSLGIFNSCAELERFFRMVENFSILDCL